VLVTNPTMPGAPVDTVAVYALPSSTSPVGTAMKRQVLAAGTSRYFSTYNSGGVAGLSASTFGTGSSATLKSESTTGWTLRGDGSVSIHPSQPIGGKPSTVVVLAGSGTYTPPVGCTHIVVEVLGGGGAGGGPATTSSGTGSVGENGSGGGYARKTLTRAQLDAGTVTYVVGAGGTGGSSGGSNGGNSTFSGAGFTTVLGGGGPGGATNGASSADRVVGGTSLSVASGGDLNIQGSPGDYNIIYPAGLRVGVGNGGKSHLGMGSIAVVPATGAGGASGQAAQATSGGGGGAGYSLANSTQRSGGAGGSGLIIVTEYYGA